MIILILVPSNPDHPLFHVSLSKTVITNLYCNRQRYTELREFCSITSTYGTLFYLYWLQSRMGPVDLGALQKFLLYSQLMGKRAFAALQKSSLALCHCVAVFTTSQTNPPSLFPTLAVHHS